MLIYSQCGRICKPAGMGKIYILISRQNLENRGRKMNDFRPYYTLHVLYFDRNSENNLF